MTKARFIFWDSDNTLTANGDLHWRKHKETLAACGIALPDEFQTRIYQNNGRQNWDWLTRELGLNVPCDDYLQQVDGWYADHVSEISFRPGIPAALDLFAAAGCRQCVVSNGRRNSVLLALEAKNIVSRFDFIMCKEDYEGRKPDAAPYLAARAKMEGIVGAYIDPASCLAIEDDPLGVKSAHGAKIPVIHRRLHRDDAHSPEAFISVFEEDEFIAACKSAVAQTS